LLSTAQVAEVLGVHRVSVAMIVRQGRLPAIKVANRWIVRRGDLDEFAKDYQAKQGRPFGWSMKDRKEKRT